jgi:hypothetical protein
MDILKVLAFNNDKGVRETVVSSIFNYFLAPSNDHGFGSSFLSRYLRALECDWVSESLLAAVDAFGKTTKLKIEVVPEWGRESNGLQESYRRLDSLLRIEYRDNLCLIGTEVKIDPASASDKTQLDAYAEMLRTQKAIAVEDEGYAPEAVNMALVYLVPSDAKGAYAFADNATERCRALGIDGVIVLNWQDSEATAGPKAARICKGTMSDILKQLLEAYQKGEISPVDAQAVDLARSLRSTALKRFDFSMMTSPNGAARFPDNEGYESSLAPYQKEVLACFRAAAKLAGCKRPLIANALHTSIGIPAQDSPIAKKNNTLCRIQTAFYGTTEPVHDFIIQIAQPIYEKHLDSLNRNLSNLAIPYVLQEVGTDGKPLYHENGKEDQPVYRILFPDHGEALDDDRKNSLQGQFANLLDVMKKAFLAEVK